MTAADLNSRRILEVPMTPALGSTAERNHVNTPLAKIKKENTQMKSKTQTLLEHKRKTKQKTL